MSGKPRKVMVPPIVRSPVSFRKLTSQNLIFKLLQQHVTVQIWLFEQIDYRIEGKIRVFPAVN